MSTIWRSRGGSLLNIRKSCVWRTANYRATFVECYICSASASEYFARVTRGVCLQTRDLTRIMLLESNSKIRGQADISLSCRRYALNQINIEHWRPSFAEASEGILLRE